MAYAIKYIDGFDEWGTSDVVAAGWSTATITVPSGRVAGQALKLGGNQNTQRSVGANAEWVIGFAFQPGGVNGTIMSLLETTTEHMRLAYNSGDTLTISRAGSIPATSAVLGLVSTNWYYIEVYYKCNDTTGAWEVRVNGTAVIGPTTGLDTRNGGTAGTPDILRLNNPNVGSATWAIDDLYIGQGGSTFQGDCRVVTKLPDADGGVLQWTASSGSQYQCVDESPPNGDSDYISDSTSGDRSTFSLAAVGVTGTVKAVALAMYARKDDAGARSINRVFRTGSTNYDGSTAYSLGTGYQYYVDVMETDPSTAAAWTVSGIDGGEFGVKDV